MALTEHFVIYAVQKDRTVLAVRLPPESYSALNPNKTIILHNQSMQSVCVIKKLPNQAIMGLTTTTKN